MSTTRFLPMLTDGAPISHLALSAIASPTGLKGFSFTTYKPTHLIAKVSIYMDYIVKQMRCLKEEAEMEKASELVTIQRLFADVRKIQDQIVLYSANLHYGIVQVDGEEGEASTTHYFVDIPANEQAGGNGREIFVKGYVYNPNYTLPQDSHFTYLTGNKMHVCAHRAAVHLYQLFLAARNMLFAIKTMQLKELESQHQRGDLTRPIDTFSYDFDGPKLPELSPASSTEENYDKISAVAKKILARCEESTSKIVAAQLEKYPDIKVMTTPGAIEVAKEKIYNAIKSLVDKKVKLTKGMSVFQKIIYDGNSSAYSDAKLKKILFAATSAHRRRFFCCFTPGRSRATKKLYAMLSEIAENYSNHAWILARVACLEFFLLNYSSKESKFNSKQGSLNQPLLAEYKDSAEDYSVTHDSQSVFFQNKKTMSFR